MIDQLHADLYDPPLTRFPVQVELADDDENSGCARCGCHTMGIKMTRLS